MLGRNNILEIEKNYTESLKIHKIYPGFKGDAPFIGMPVVILSLGGCNLACNFCDIDFDNYTTIAEAEIIASVINASKNEQNQVVRQTIFITGGEPLVQPINEICTKLLDMGYNIIVETNGTIYRELDNRIKVCVSPKAVNNEYLPIRDDIIRRAVAIKFLISMNRLPYNQVPDVGQFRYNIDVFLQPMDEINILNNLNNLKYCLDICNKFGYNYSIQTQKIIGEH